MEAAALFRTTKKGLARATPSIIWFCLVQRAFFWLRGKGREWGRVFVCLKRNNKNLRWDFLIYRRGLVFILFGITPVCPLAYILVNDTEEAVASRPLASLPNPRVSNRTSCLNVISLHTCTAASARSHRVMSMMLHRISCQVLPVNYQRNHRFPPCWPFATLSDVK